MLKNLREVKGIGTKRAAHITQTLSDLQLSLAEIAAHSADWLRTTFRLPRNVAEEFASMLHRWFHDPDRAEMAKRNIREIRRGDALYPKRLSQILGDKAPEVLYVWGNLALLQRRAVGFCGSRDVSAAGLHLTETIAAAITHQEWVVVSGHARGVDMTAHQTALEHDGATIIVAAEGILSFKLKVALKQAAKPENLLIVSEFPPRAGWNVGNAMTRNRTIIGLSDVMVLIESRVEGGTFEAGKAALKLNVPLFVAPSPSAQHLAPGNAHFIAHGAKAIEQIDDGLTLSPLLQMVGRRAAKAKKSPVDGQPVELQLQLV